MRRVGIIGLGDMGIGMAKNIIKNGFNLVGYDLRDERMRILETFGGKSASRRLSCLSGCRYWGIKI